MTLQTSLSHQVTMANVPEQHGSNLVSFIKFDRWRHRGAEKLSDMILFTGFPLACKPQTFIISSGHQKFVWRAHKLNVLYCWFLVHRFLRHTYIGTSLEVDNSSHSALQGLFYLSIFYFKLMHGIAHICGLQCGYMYMFIICLHIYVYTVCHWMYTVASDQVDWSHQNKSFKILSFGYCEIFD